MTCISGYDDASNDAGNAESNFDYYGVQYTSLRGMFPFLHSECIKLQKGRLRNEMPLNFILKERFLVFKNFDQS